MLSCRCQVRVFLGPFLSFLFQFIKVSKRVTAGDIAYYSTMVCILHKLSVIRSISSGDLMYIVVIIAHNNVLHT